MSRRRRGLWPLGRDDHRLGGHARGDILSVLE
jgi:hypothetical protein